MYRSGSGYAASFSKGVGGISQDGQSRTKSKDNGECIEAAPFMEQKSREYLEEFAAVVPWEVNPSLNMTP